MRGEAKEQVSAFLARKRSYAMLFATPAGKEVLKDLAKFCRATTPCWSVDPRDHARYEGRREVWLRIMQHVRLPEEELWRLLGGLATIQQLTETFDV